MGAVQKLATVVMIGLVAMATVFLVYAAAEPNRRDTQVTRQDDLAIERGTELYITYCLQCHAPDGTGAMEGTGRIGGVLNQEKIGDKSGLPIVYQSDDPAMQAKAEHFIRYRLENGAPGDPRLPTLMPAFGQDLNVEQVNDLVYLIMHGDWNYVY
ncbi:MAG: c-type cytochrome, partial [Thermomicrobiales bacterium]